MCQAVFTGAPDDQASCGGGVLSTPLEAWGGQEESHEPHRPRCNDPANGLTNERQGG
jgi:hypothetical protein